MQALSQQLIYRAVFGAVKNAADGHPKWPLDETIARSIAKRATGTLTSLYGSDVLAARASSDMPNGVATSRAACVWVSRSKSGKRTRMGSPVRTAVKAAGRRSQLRLLHNAVGFMAGEAKRASQPDRAAALIDVLRLIAKMQKGASK